MSSLCSGSVEGECMASLFISMDFFLRCRLQQRGTLAPPLQTRTRVCNCVSEDVAPAQQALACSKLLRRYAGSRHWRARLSVPCNSLPELRSGNGSFYLDALLSNEGFFYLSQMSASAPAPAELPPIWYKGPAAFRANAMRGNTQYTFGNEHIMIESGLMTRKTEVLRWNQIKDIGFQNTCSMRCCCNCDAGEITVFAPGDASTGGVYTFYVPNAREVFQKMCIRVVAEQKKAQPKLIGEYPAETGLSCCESGGNYKIYTTHIELEHYSRRCITLCGIFSDKKIDFVQMSSITDQNKTETCCSGSFISIFVKDASAILHAFAGAAATTAKMDLASYQAAPVEFRLYVHKDNIESVFKELNDRGGEGAAPSADPKMQAIAAGNA